MDELLTSFPEPSERMQSSVWKLERIARGGDDADRIRKTGEILPRFWDPTTIADPRLRWEVWMWLDQFVIWLNTQHAWFGHDLTPACWPEHPPLTRYLAALAAQRFIAGQATGPAPLAEWHRYDLPTYLDHTREQRAACAEKHQPWPARAAHRRHIERAAAANRLRAFRRDLDGA